MAKNEVEMTEADAQLLHVAGQHLAAAALPEIGKAAMEAKALYEHTQDERFNSLLVMLEEILTPLTDVLRDVLGTIPGVIIPTADELQVMIAEAKAEEEFMELVKKEAEVLH